MMADWVTSAEVRAMLDGISIKTLQRYRAKYWLEGIHYAKPVQRCFYNRPLIEHWIVYGTKSLEHQEAMEAFYRQNNQKGKRRAG